MQKGEEMNWRLKKMDQNGWVFIHIPRTAGNSIVRALGCWGGHVPMRYVQEELPDPGGTVSFSVVRNPWDQVVSWHAHCRRAGHTRSEFKRFVMEDENPWHRNEEYPEAKEFNAWDQWHYVSGPDGGQIVDTVLRFEELNVGGFERIRALTGFQGRFGHHNAAAHRPYREVHDDETRAKVRDVNSRLIEEFGYEF